MTSTKRAASTGRKAGSTGARAAGRTASGADGAAGRTRRAAASRAPAADDGAQGGAQASAAAGASASQAASAGTAAPPKGMPFADGPMAAFSQLLGKSFPALSMPPAKLAALQEDYVRQWQDLLGRAGSKTAPALNDKRFAHAAWQENGPFAWAAALYLLNSNFMRRMADALEGDERTRERVRFMTQQWVDMLSPANFVATTPEVQRKLLETNGESLKAGMQNLLADLEKGHMSQTDEAAFEVGRNVATTAGSVVFQNELMQLIQYDAVTPSVAERPLLMVPPSVNKFYIMDLQPENSLVAHALANGNTVFMVSWRNVGADLGHLTWDDYLESGIFEAIRVVREITGAPTINALGFCVGGTMLATGLAALASRGERPVAALTLMTTLLDFARPGVLGALVDEPSIVMREQTIGKGGLLHGQELATTFSFLRPNDLVWNYYVNNYLKGEQPPAFDLLYWNSDSTNLPGPMYSWFMRHTYLQNELKIPGRLVCAGEPIDLGSIGVPTFVFGAREDHIVPWFAAYDGARLLSGSVQFVLGASGHIAGAINPASKNKRSYWLGPPPQIDSDSWFEQAVEQPGSWWNEWTRWLQPHQGAMQPAPDAVGSADHPPIEPAPGSYVKVKAD